MANIDTDLIFDDFEIEARAHIEKIEASFLDTGSLASDPDMMNSIFRAAHSLKGTAGFFSLDKIVAVAHALESVFMMIKDGVLSLDEDIVDVVLQSVDCLKNLVDNIRDDSSITTDEVIEALLRHACAENHNRNDGAGIEYASAPFCFADPRTESKLRSAHERMHNAYYIKIDFNRGLRKHYRHPKGMIDCIQSVGSIVEAIINSKSDEIIWGDETDELNEKIAHVLSGHDTSVLELLITSPLEHDILAETTELSAKSINPLPWNIVFGNKGSVDNPNVLGKDAKSLASKNAEPRVEPWTEPRPVPRPEPQYEEAKNTPRHSGAADGLKANAEQGSRKNSAHDSSFLLHLDISVINNLLDLANEMILTRNQLISITPEYRKSVVGLMPVLQDLNRLTSEIQEKIMQTRMQPINVIFSKFPRFVRDTAKALDKEIMIEVLGADVTLDKYLLDELIDPITQLVKNAADHGVEAAERRLALGKPQKGKITLCAYILDGTAIIEVTDDGSGMDVEALKQKALDRGFASEETLASMPDSEALELILNPGFSMARHLTSLSGRGVGMDIVKTNIERLGGLLEIETKVGVGTTMRLRMPLTLSVVRSLIVVIDKVKYAVPEVNIERIVRIGHAMRSKRLERVNDSLVLLLDGRIIPVVTMGEIDAKSKGSEPPSAASLLEEYLRDGVFKCVVLKAGEKSFALMIDDALGAEQTLVKPLPKFFKSCLCYSSVTVLGDGSAIAILDPDGIMRFLGIKGEPRDLSVKEADQSVEADKKQYLVFMCSGTEHFAIEIAAISKIEKIGAVNIQEVGAEQYINVSGETIRVVRPERYIPVKKRRYASETLYLLILRNCARPIGLLARKVLDIVEGTFEFDKDLIISDYVFGTAAYGEKTIIFPDTAAIVGEIEKEKHKKKKTKKAGAEV